jgi:hypothetical protein
MAAKYLDLMYTDAVCRAQKQYYGIERKITGAFEPDPLGQAETEFIAARTASTWVRSAKPGGRTFSIAEGLRDSCA